MFVEVCVELCGVVCGCVQVCVHQCAGVCMEVCMCGGVRVCVEVWFCVHSHVQSAGFYAWMCTCDGDVYTCVWSLNVCR